jgi:competence protein ComEC
MLDALEDRNVRTYETAAKPDESSIEWDERVKVSVLSPWEDQEDMDLNNSSVVCRLEYGETSILLAGDAEEDAEEWMLQNCPNEMLQSDVLKVGHHGSSSSSSMPFLEAVKPEMAVISLGLDNSYGHPHAETLERFEEMDIEVFRTDLQGNILVTLNGKDLSVEPID